MKKISKLLIKIAFSGLAIFYVLSKFDLNEVLNILSQTDVYLFFLVILFGIINNFLCSWRWFLINKNLYDINIPYIQTVKLYFIGSFFNLFLPTNIGGDTVRAYHTYKKSQNNGKSIYSVILDRATGLLVLLLIGYFSTIAAIIGGLNINQYVVYSINSLLIILIIASIIAYEIYKTNNEYFVNNRILRCLKNIVNDFFLLSKQYRLLLSTSLISLAFQLLAISNSYIIARSIGLDVSLIYFLIFIPIISILVTLPISFFGVGIREIAYVVMFSSIGVQAEKAITMSFLLFLALIVIGLLGGIVYIMDPAPKDGARH